jgi:succinate dehydrogenase flavin-adding protein (antitoxin of CptAB toxin-antitoxin module)
MIIMDSMDILRKKLAYQLTYRGTKELDHVMNRIRREALPDLPDDLLPALQAFLKRPEPELMAMVFGHIPLPHDLPAELKEVLGTVSQEDVA